MGLHCLDTRAKRGVLYYGRFTDDAILIMEASLDERLALCNEIKERSDFFALQFEVC